MDVANGEMLGMLTQFGTAGLIAWMWLTERRSASSRERQLTEAHERLIEQRVQLEQLIRVVSDSTRAATAVEEGQRRLAEAIDRFTASGSRLRLRGGEGGGT